VVSTRYKVDIFFLSYELFGQKVSSETELLELTDSALVSESTSVSGLVVCVSMTGSSFAHW
jgi:hypothetical protein